MDLALARSIHENDPFHGHYVRRWRCVGDRDGRTAAGGADERLPSGLMNPEVGEPPRT